MKRAILYILSFLTILPLRSQEASVLARGDWWKMDITTDGIHRLTTAQLPALAGVPCSTLAIYGTRGGMLELQNRLTPIGDLTQVATEVVDHNHNGTFDAGDELLFYAEGPSQWRFDSDLQRWTYRRHAYSNTNSYYLTTSSPTPYPLRITVGEQQSAGGNQQTAVSHHTAVAIHDNDLVSPYQSGQIWLGERLSSSNPTRTFSLGLPAQPVDDPWVRYAVANVGGATSSFTFTTAGFSDQLSISRTTVYTSAHGTIASRSQNYTFTLTFQPGENMATGYLDYIELNAQVPIVFSGGQLKVRGSHQPSTPVAFSANASRTFRVWDVTEAGTERELLVDGSTWVDSTDRPRQYLLFDGTHYLTPDAITPLPNQDLHGSAAADLVVITLPQYLDQARRLATLHEVFDGLDAVVVTDQQVFNEFSSGQQDPLAFRSYLRWLRQQHPQQPPRYLVLFGKGTFDNRHIQYSTTSTLATYQTPYSFDDDGRSYASDDILCFLADGATGTTSERLDASVGRLPARDTAEARHLVDKIEAYITRRDLDDESQRGDWRNYVALLADDADPGSPHDSIFAHSSEVVARNILQRYPHLHIDRLYADAYHQTSGSIGSYYPDLNNALRQRINYGCLLLNYIGHGSTEYIGTERYIEPADLASYTNHHRLPLLVTSTCSYGHFDQPEKLCGAEAALLAPAGMIAVISASRPISHVERFNNEVVVNALNPSNTIGDALRLTKNRYPGPLCIGITGDPALRLCQPTNRIRITHINTQEVSDTADVLADVLSRVTVSGEIVDTTGLLLNDFEGTIYPVVYDRPVRATTLANDNPGTEVSFVQQKNILYKGSHPVSGGRFEYSFIVPKDVSYRYDYAKLAHYAKSATDHASGSYLRLMLGGMSDSSDIAFTPPQIRLYVGDTNFRPGAITGPNPTLLAHLFDSAGINVGTGLGHDITAMIDDNPGSLIVLNDFYQPDIADSRFGSVAYTLKGLPPGRHTFTLKAWNIFGISATATTHFTVRGADTLTLADMQCRPNPASTSTQISLRTNCPDRISTAQLHIYNAQGKCIFTFTPDISTQGHIIGPVRWDVSQVPPGLYLARMIVTTTDGDTRQIATKCIVR